MIARVYHNLTVLPTGNVLVTGGLRTDAAKDTTAKREPQIWNPSTGTWSAPGTLGSDRARRGYHSTAILLPDGRVLSAGGEIYSANVSEAGYNPYNDNFTIYCPPYLFSGNNLATRPPMTGWPSTMAYGRRYTVCIDDDASTIASACLIRPGAVTHGFNQDQRYVPLGIVDRCSGQLIVETPNSANFTPAGYYLLFIVNTSGVPAVGQWVSLVAGTIPPDTCDVVPPASTFITVDYGRYGARVSWTAAGDDGNCGTAEKFDLRYSTAAITDANFLTATQFAPVSTIIPGPPGTAYCVEVPLSPCGIYYFALKTRDDHSQWSALSDVVSGSIKCTGSLTYICDESGMQAQGWGDGGWAGESSLSWESGGAAVEDRYQLRGTAGPVTGQYRVRLVKGGSGAAELDRVSLGAVDHDPSAQAYAGADRVFIGSSAPVLQVRDDAGADVTSQVTGSSATGYGGSAGQSLLVDLAASGSSNTALVLASSGSTPRVGADSTGILVQKPDGSGWQTIAHVFRGEAWTGVPSTRKAAPQSGWSSSGSIPSAPWNASSSRGPRRRSGWI